MGIVTLISDMGTRDHYVAAVKAAILGHHPTITIVDITHHIGTFNIREAAFVLRSVWTSFPLGTVHLIGILPEWTAATPHVVVSSMGHYFVSADNGIFSLLFDEPQEEVFEIDPKHNTDWNFPMKGSLALAAAHLARGGVPELLGKKLPGYRHSMPVTPIVDPFLIRAHVVYIDHYGNVYTNLRQDLFEETRRGRSFSIIAKRSSYVIDRLSAGFDSVEEGEILAMWASNGQLMLAVRGGATGNGGSIASLLGFQLNDIVRIEFYGDPDR